MIEVIFSNNKYTAQTADEEIRKIILNELTRFVDINPFSAIVNGDITYRIAYYTIGIISRLEISFYLASIFYEDKKNFLVLRYFNEQTAFRNIKDTEAMLSGVVYNDQLSEISRMRFDQLKLTPFKEIEENINSKVAISNN